MPVNTTAYILLAIALLLAIILLTLVYRRRQQSPLSRLQKSCKELLTDFLIPNGEEGEVHIDYALLCSRGIVILNIKDIEGNVFGSDAMQEWAVITGKSRFGFRNPQDGLFDRVAAIKRLVPDVPVQGYIAFTRKAMFTKGVPNHVVMFDALLDELQQELKQQADVDAFWPAWEKLKSQTVAQHSG